MGIVDGDIPPFPPFFLPPPNATSSSLITCRFKGARAFLVVVAHQVL